MPLSEDREARLKPLSSTPAWNENESYILLVTEEDCFPENLGLKQSPEAVVGMNLAHKRSALPTSEAVVQFTHGAIKDTLKRCEQKFNCSSKITNDTHLAETLIEIMSKTGITNIVTSYLSVGPTADAIASTHTKLVGYGIRLHAIKRVYDAACWPHTTRGFFKLKEKIPSIITQLGLS